jgi:hypothetical protein
MSEQNESRPPARKAAPETAADQPDNTGFDDLAAQQRRRASAVRLTGAHPDPLHPGRRYHRPPTGLRAAGYRDGYLAALRWVLREHASGIDELVRAKLAAIISRMGSQ